MQLHMGIGQRRQSNLKIVLRSPRWPIVVRKRGYWLTRPFARNERAEG